MIKTIPSTILWIFLCYSIQCQNLIANGGFEDTNTCSEYAAPCAPEAWFRIPPTDLFLNTRKVDQSYEGKHAELIVIENKKHPISYRVFLYTMLLCPLEKNQVYQLSFYLNPGLQSEIELGVLFSEEELINSLVNPFDFEPSVILSEIVKPDQPINGYWHYLELSYKAKGGEKFLTFGNFNKNPMPIAKEKKMNNKHGDLMYMIDNVALLALDTPNHSFCDTLLARQQLYETNHRHTYKKGIRKRPRKIRPRFSPVIDTFLRLDTIQRPVSATNQVKKYEISDIVFDFDQHTINPAYQYVLDSIISIIQTHDPKRIEIIGHTDDIGTNDYNLVLSKKRAQSVESYLMQQFATYTGMINSSGKGEEDPKVTNKTAEQRKMNRRVEILIRL